MPFGLYTTPLSAFKYALKSAEEELQYCISEKAKETDPAEAAKWDADIANHEKEIRLLKSRLTKLKNANQKNKAA